MGAYWSSSAPTQGVASMIHFDEGYDSRTWQPYKDIILDDDFSRGYGLSIRCVKNSPTS